MGWFYRCRNAVALGTQQTGNWTMAGRSWIARLAADMTIGAEASGRKTWSLVARHGGHCFGDPNAAGGMFCLRTLTVPPLPPKRPAPHGNRFEVHYPAAPPPAVFVSGRGGGSASEEPFLLLPVQTVLCVRLSQAFLLQAPLASQASPPILLCLRGQPISEPLLGPLSHVICVIQPPFWLMAQHQSLCPAAAAVAQLRLLHCPRTMVLSSLPRTMTQDSYQQKAESTKARIQTQHRNETTRTNNQTTQKRQKNNHKKQRITSMPMCHGTWCHRIASPRLLMCCRMSVHKSACRAGPLDPCHLCCCHAQGSVYHEQRNIDRAPFRGLCRALSAARTSPLLLACFSCPDMCVDVFR